MKPASRGQGHIPAQARRTARRVGVVVSALGIVAALTQVLWTRHSVDAPEQGIVDATCNLERSACHADFGAGARVSISATPRPLRPEAPLALRVTVAGVRPREVGVDFSAERINMGVLRVGLVAGADGTWSGTVTLPACVTGRMTWLAALRVDGDGRRLLAQWRFDAGGR